MLKTRQSRENLLLYSGMGIVSLYLAGCVGLAVWHHIRTEYVMDWLFSLDFMPDLFWVFSLGVGYTIILCVAIYLCYRLINALIVKPIKKWVANGTEETAESVVTNDEAVCTCKQPQPQAEADAYPEVTVPEGEDWLVRETKK